MREPMQRDHLDPRSGRHRGAARRAGALALLATLTLGAAACGDDDEDEPDDTGVGNTVVNSGPMPTTAGTGPLETYEVDTQTDGSPDGTVLGDPMEPSTNDTTGVSQP